MDTRPDYQKYYSDRGIGVCKEWEHDFSAFYDHIGPKPSPEHSVDRIDNNKGYEPGNVRWATKAEQTENRRAYSNTGVKFIHQLPNKYYSVAIWIDGKRYQTTRKTLAAAKIALEEIKHGVLLGA